MTLEELIKWQPPAAASKSMKVREKVERRAEVERWRNGLRLAEARVGGPRLRAQFEE